MKKKKLVTTFDEMTGSATRSQIISAEVKRSARAAQISLQQQIAARNPVYAAFLAKRAAKQNG